MDTPDPAPPADTTPTATATAPSDTQPSATTALTAPTGATPTPLSSTPLPTPPGTAPSTDDGRSDSGLAAERARSRAFQSCQKSARSAAARRRCLTRHGRTPGPVAGLKARALSSTSVRLSFRAASSDARRPPAARSYLVYQSLSTTDARRGRSRPQTLCKVACRFPVTRVGEILTLTVTDLIPGKTYYYAVVARDNVSSRRGARSAVASVKTPARRAARP
ncbi:MAG: fibronectin type III domain-containing protein [Solirubrobacteraceae bacterium]